MMYEKKEAITARVIASISTISLSRLYLELVIHSVPGELTLSVMRYVYLFSNFLMSIMFYSQLFHPSTNLLLQKEII